MPSMSSLAVPASTTTTIGMVERDGDARRGSPARRRRVRRCTSPRGARPRTSARLTNTESTSEPIARMPTACSTDVLAG